VEEKPSQEAAKAEDEDDDDTGSCCNEKESAGQHGKSEAMQSSSTERTAYTAGAMEIPIDNSGRSRRSGGGQGAGRRIEENGAAASPRRTLFYGESTR